MSSKLYYMYKNFLSNNYFKTVTQNYIRTCFFLIIMYRVPIFINRTLSKKEIQVQWFKTSVSFIASKRSIINLAVMKNTSMQIDDDFPDRTKTFINLCDSPTARIPLFFSNLGRPYRAAKMILSQLETDLNRRKSSFGWFYRFSRHWYVDPTFGHKTIVWVRFYGAPSPYSVARLSS